MKNKEQWEFAQKYSANLALMVLSTVLIIQCILYMLYQSSAMTDLTTLGFWLIGMGIVIVTVERKLKKREQ